MRLGNRDAFEVKAGYPICLRDHRSSNEPRFIEVERFLSDTEVDY